MRLKPKTGSALALLLLLTACRASQNGEPANRDTIAGVEWRLAELNGRAPAPRTDDRAVFFKLDGQQRVEGFGGCNRFSGTYNLSGDRLRFGPLLSTRMACAENNLTQQEQAALEALNTIDRYVRYGDSLTLLAGDRTVARFTARQ